MKAVMFSICLNGMALEFTFGQALAASLFAAWHRMCPSFSLAHI
jgi:hypothetical protein